MVYLINGLYFSPSSPTIYTAMPHNKSELAGEAVSLSLLGNLITPSCDWTVNDEEQW